MTTDEKILFLEKLLAQASKRLKDYGVANAFYLYDDGYAFELKTNDSIAKKLNENTTATFSLNFPLHRIDAMRKSLKMKHSIKTIINRWKKLKRKTDEEILLHIVDMMEKSTIDGYAIVIEFISNLCPGIFIWHANVPIEQLEIELDVQA